jgi:hypothetical protein
MPPYDVSNRLELLPFNTEVVFRPILKGRYDMKGLLWRGFPVVLCVIASAVLLLDIGGSSAGEQPAKQAAIFRDASLPPVAFATSEIRRALEENGFSVKEKRESLTGMQKQLRLLVVGTREYAKLEQRITMSQAELAGSIQTRKVEFARREARLYHNVYQEIGQVVEEYARDNNLSVVLRFSDDPVNANDSKAIQQQINRTVVWHDRGRDLTRIILQQLIQKSREAEEAREASPGDPAEPVPEPPTNSE